MVSFDKKIRFPRKHKIKVSTTDICIQNYVIANVHGKAIWKYDLYDGKRFNWNLWNIDLLDTHSDLSDRNITSKHFVCFQDVFKMTSKDVFKTPSKHVFKTSLRHAIKTSSRDLKRNNFSSSKMSWRRRLQDVLKHEKLLRWRRVEDTFKTYLEDQKMFTGIGMPFRIKKLSNKDRIIRNTKNLV